MSTGSAEEFAGIAVMVVYGVVAVLTLLVILRKARLIKLPRQFALVTWYAVIVIGLSWLLFFSVYMFLHHDGSSRLAGLAYILSFTPVYICGLVLLFAYPKKAV